MIDVFSGTGMEEMVLNLKDMIPQMGGRKTKRRRLTVPEALEALVDEEAAKLIDVDKLTKEAIRRAEQAGIIFIDEIDKVAGREGGGGGGPDVSREGVQRDLLPIVEGSTVSTKYGPLKTDHVLFIAAGAFHVSKPKDLIPELQGRFPIRVELESLSDDDFVRILTEPENALTKQYTALLATEGVTLDIQADAVAEIARIAALVNARMENIGARRLHTIMERVLDELAFEAPGLGQSPSPSPPSTFVSASTASSKTRIFSVRTLGGRCRKATVSEANHGRPRAARRRPSEQRARARTERVSSVVDAAAATAAVRGRRARRGCRVKGRCRAPGERRALPPEPPALAPRGIPDCPPRMGSGPRAGAPRQAVAPGVRRHPSLCWARQAPGRHRRPRAPCAHRSATAVSVAVGPIAARPLPVGAVVDGPAVDEQEARADEQVGLVRWRPVAECPRSIQSRSIPSTR